jgi:hypothetical protein
MKAMYNPYTSGTRVARCCLATSYKHSSYCYVTLSEKVFIVSLPIYTRYIIRVYIYIYIHISCHVFMLCDSRRGMDSRMDLLTTCIHHSELHFTDDRHTQTIVLSLLQFPLAVSWQRFLLREILHHPSIRSSCHSLLCRIFVN